MTHFSFKYFLRFAWGIFTGEILLFHNLHLSPGTDLQYKDKKDEQVTTEELMRIKKITGHYLVKDYSTHMEHYAKFEDKPKHKTALLNRLTSNSLRPGIDLMHMVTMDNDTVLYTRNLLQVLRVLITHKKGNCEVMMC